MPRSPSIAIVADAALESAVAIVARDEGRLAI